MTAHTHSVAGSLHYQQEWCIVDTNSVEIDSISFDLNIDFDISNISSAANFRPIPVFYDLDGKVIQPIDGVITQYPVYVELPIAGDVHGCLEVEFHGHYVHFDLDDQNEFGQIEIDLSYIKDHGDHISSHHDNFGNHIPCCHCDCGHSHHNPENVWGGFPGNDVCEFDLGDFNVNIDFHLDIEAGFTHHQC